MLGEVLTRRTKGGWNSPLWGGSSPPRVSSLEESSKPMTVSKSGVVLNRLSILSSLLLIASLFFAHANPLGAVFLWPVGLAFIVFWCVLFIVSIVRLFRNKKDGYLKSSLPLTINLLPVIAVLIFANLESAKYLTDKDIVIEGKMLSPDGSHEIIEYKFDIGALGYTNTRTAIIAVKDESRNLAKFTLPNEYGDAKWLTNDSVEVEVDIRRYQAEKKTFKQHVSRIGDIKVIVHIKGFDTSSPLFVLHRSLSPDGGKELVAYRYRNGKDRGQLHITVIRKGGIIPCWGNIYIGSDPYDFVYFGEWRTPQKIVLYTTSRYMAKKYLLDHSGIDVEFIQDKLATPPKQWNDN